MVCENDRNEMSKWPDVRLTRIRTFHFFDHCSSNFGKSEIHTLWRIQKSVDCGFYTLPTKKKLEFIHTMLKEIQPVFSAVLQLCHGWRVFASEVETDLNMLPTGLARFSVVEGVERGYLPVCCSGGLSYVFLLGHHIAWPKGDHIWDGTGWKVGVYIRGLIHGSWAFFDT